RRRGVPRTPRARSRGGLPRGPEPHAADQWDGAVRLALERLGFRPAAERARVRTGAARGRRGRHRVAGARRRPAWPRPRRRGPPQMSRAPEDFVRSTVRPLAAYGPPRDPAPVPLHLNESPDDVPPELKRELSAQLEAMDWSKYPITDGARLAADLAQAFGVDRAGVLVGNGSNELLQLLLFACIEPGDTVVVVAPSFALYALQAKALGASVIAVPLRGG